jgi:hypothetical protein
MAQVYNRGWLRTLIGSYLHDNGVAAIADTWIDVAAKRVSMVLECREMEAELARLTGDPDTFIPLPNTVRKVLAVCWNYTGRERALRSIPKHYKTQYDINGTPAVYWIENSTIKIGPFTDGDYVARVVQDVEIPADDQAEIPALTSHPYVFLNAALAEAYDWKQNAEMVARFEGKWREEASIVTAEYLNEQAGDAPAMRSY